VARRDQDESALLALQRATHATLQLLAAELVDLDLTASEINALANLADGRARMVSELGADIGLRPTTLTSVLDRLERRAYVTRGARRDDRRVVVIELTAAGKLVAATVKRAFSTLERQALSELRPDEVAGFHAVVRALTDAAG
jgi:MarR family transcriptional regulator, organic hydroperoxide resistance regulator